MKGFCIVVVFLFFLPTVTFTQYADVYTIPLPDKFNGMRQIEGIASTPNPNLPAFENKTRRDIVWRHNTTITAPENLKVIETGAYLLMNGTWWLRASFKPRATKKMFNTKSLKLGEGQKIIFKNNNRYGYYTQTGFNFWYFIAEDAQGNNVFGYEILETAGKMADGTEVLPLIKDKSTLNWVGKAGDSDYQMTGTVNASQGQLIIKNNAIIGGYLNIDLTTIASETQSLVDHLMTVDFFNTKEYPTATFNARSVIPLTDSTVTLVGQLTLLGNTLPYELTAQFKQTEKAFKISVDKAAVNRVSFGMYYASTADEGSTDYSISDFFYVNGTIAFQKDYPGSMPWNSVKPAE